MTRPQHAPLFTPAQAGALLDQIVYEQILECVDLEAIYSIEQSIILMVEDLHAMPHDRATETARALVDRCLIRLPDDIRRFVQAGAFLSFDAVARCQDCPGGPPPRRPPSSPTSS